MVLDQRWKLKAEKRHLQEEEKKEEKHLLFSLMKSKIICLSKNDEFKEILKGRKNSNKYFTIFFKKLSDKNNKKLNISFVAQKKIGNAVKRNKIKRRLRNIMNDATKKINLNFNYSYLLIAKKNVFEDQYENIKIALFNDFKGIK